MSEKNINTIIVTELPGSAEILHRVLADSHYKIIFDAANLQQLLSVELKLEPQLIIVVTQSSDNTLLSKLKIINEQYPLPIVIFTNDDNVAAIEQAIQAGVSAYIVDGLVENRVLPIVKTAIARFKQFQQMKQQLDDLKTSLADRKLIDRAKGLIMQQRQCSEDEAYKLMRTSAMNQNMRMAKLAKNILETANLLEVNDKDNSLLSHP